MEFKRGVENNAPPPLSSAVLHGCNHFHRQRWVHNKALYRPSDPNPCFRMCGCHLSFLYISTVFVHVVVFLATSRSYSERLHGGQSETFWKQCLHSPWSSLGRTRLQPSHSENSKSNCFSAKWNAWIPPPNSGFSHLSDFSSSESHNLKKNISEIQEKCHLTDCSRDKMVPDALSGLMRNVFDTLPHCTTSFTAFTALCVELLFTHKC